MVGAPDASLALSNFDINDLMSVFKPTVSAGGAFDVDADDACDGDSNLDLTDFTKLPDDETLSVLLILSLPLWLLSEFTSSSFLSTTSLASCPLVPLSCELLAPWLEGNSELLVSKSAMYC